MHSPEDSLRRGLPVLAKWGLPVLAALFGGISVLSLVQLAKERQQTKQLAAGNQALNASLSQVQNQLQTVSERLNALSAAAESPRPAHRSASAPARPRAGKRAVARQTPASDSRLDQMQARLNEQQREITSTRADLEGRLSSARDELSGSIARTHEELMALQKRGERNYYEFQLDKSKRFQRFGPVSLSLRKADRKRGSYDVAMIVDDRQLQKKRVNLYEPVLITLSDKPEPVVLVVNGIHKDQVKGYVSEPKYKKSELASNVPPAAPADKPAGLQQR